MSKIEMEDEEFGDVSEGSDDGVEWADCGGEDEAARFARLQHEISRLNQLMYAAEDRTAHCSHLYERFTSEMRAPPSQEGQTPVTPPPSPQSPATACARKCDIPSLDRAFLLWRHLERMRLAVSALRLQVKQRQLDTLMQVNEFLIGAESGKAAAVTRSETSVRQDIALNSFRVALLECSLLSSTASSLAASVRAQHQVPEMTEGWAASMSSIAEEVSTTSVCAGVSTVDRGTSPRPALSKRPYFNWPASRAAKSSLELAPPSVATARICHSDSLVA